MINLKVPANKRLVWYLAAEEYFAHNIEQFDDGVFFTWIVEPTVIFGRHQVMQQEVNVEFCQENGINMFRRKSGGGCVYADEGNIMLSYIVPSTHSEQVFDEFLSKLVEWLKKYNFSAVSSEHNDVLIDGYKVSGNACYALKNSTIVHGTMLYDVDFDKLQSAITPSVQKLQKHGVKSVRQRVKNIKQISSKFEDVKELERAAINHFCQDRCVVLTQNQMDEIDKIEATYLDRSFIEGK